MAMIPDYGKGKASAMRVLNLKNRRTKIDPQNTSGIVLVSIYKVRRQL